MLIMGSRGFKPDLCGRSGGGGGGWVSVQKMACPHTRLA
jgi:hypothetical protein